MRKNRLFKRSAAAILATVVALSSFALTAAAADSVIDPREAGYGFYVETYKKNINDNDTPETNPAIGLLQGFAKLWETGDDWNTGTILKDDIIRRNIAKSYEIAGGRTAEEASYAYDIEFNDMNWNILDGLGEFKDTFIAESGIGEDKSKWELKSKAKLYFPAYLVWYFRDNAASTSPAKTYYQFPRPYRWNKDTMVPITDGYVNAQVVPEIAEKKNIADISASSDGGFPSGHTNAVFLAAFALAHSFPQQYDELMMTAAQIGYSRIIAGMHSPLDVMGGRLMATARSASILYDKKDPAVFVKAAYTKGQENLFGGKIPEIATRADYDKYKENLTKFKSLLTYDFPQDEAGKTLEMKVPKGAEALLMTRQPYLTEEQRRYVLYTTGLEGGYPLLDDEEGWGRLNLLAAANGYASFLTDVTVDMDASKGAYNACDSWLNDISGSGKLTKKGTGTLALVGDNTFTGGVNVEGGSLVMVSKTALGKGDVSVTGGILAETISGASGINGNYKQEKDGTLKLTIGSANDLLEVSGKASLAGKLVIELADNFKLDENTVVMKAQSIEGNFNTVEISGKKNWKSVVKDGQITIVQTAEKVSIDSKILIIAAVAGVVVIIVIAAAVMGKKKK